MFLQLPYIAQNTAYHEKFLYKPNNMQATKTQNWPFSLRFLLLSGRSDRSHARPSFSDGAWSFISRY